MTLNMNISQQVRARKLRFSKIDRTNIDLKKLFFCHFLVALLVCNKNAFKVFEPKNDNNPFYSHVSTLIPKKTCKIESYRGACVIFRIYVFSSFERYIIRNVYVQIEAFGCDFVQMYPKSHDQKWVHRYNFNTLKQTLESNLVPKGIGFYKLHNGGFI